MEFKIKVKKKKVPLIKIDKKESLKVFTRYSNKTNAFSYSHMNINDFAPAMIVFDNNSQYSVRMIATYISKGYLLLS